MAASEDDDEEEKEEAEREKEEEKSICQLHQVDNPSQAVLLSQHIGLGLGGGGCLHASASFAE